MLAFAVEYKKAINEITADQELKLRKYELLREEWEIVVQLRDVLKVSLSQL